jgi:hypothetical protein
MTDKPNHEDAEREDAERAARVRCIRTYLETLSDQDVLDLRRAHDKVREQRQLALRVAYLRGAH